jgi:hypothetical protein
VSDPHIEKKDADENDPNYIWYLPVKLSPNAMNFLHRIVSDYEPEPWEGSMRKYLLELFDRDRYPHKATEREIAEAEVL